MSSASFDDNINMEGFSTANKVPETSLGIEGDRCSPTAIRTLPLDTENPFQNPFCDSDIVLVVEGQKLYVHKNILSMHSPVFYRMFHGNYLESGAKDIEIKDTSYQAMLALLRQMYPVHDIAPIQSDQVLVDLLPLADYYQVDHICCRCEDYLGLQLRSLKKQGGKFSRDEAEKIMLYLNLCEKFRLEKFDKALNLASKLTLAEMDANSQFSSLESATQFELLKMRCQMMDTSLSEFVQVVSHNGYFTCFQGKCLKCRANLNAVLSVCGKCVNDAKVDHLQFNYP